MTGVQTCALPISPSVRTNETGLWALWRSQPWRETNPARQLAWAVLAILGLHSLLEYPLWYGPFQLAAGLSLLLLWLSRAAASSSADHLLAGPYSSSSGWRLRSALALGLVAGAAYAAIDYARVLQFYLPASARIRLLSEPSLSSAHRSWLFGHWVDFAQATSTPVDAGNANRMQELNEAILHLSPEEVRETKLTVGEALGLLMSFGSVVPKPASKE